jgi:hypothetical protein
VLDGAVLLLETSEEIIPAREFGWILRSLGERGLLAAADAVLVARPPTKPQPTAPRLPEPTTPAGTSSATTSTSTPPPPAGSPTVAVPDVMGQQEDDACRAVESAGLTCQPNPVSSAQGQVGEVLQLTPGAGSQVVRGYLVTAGYHAGHGAEAARHVPWLRPPLRAVLQAHLHEAPDDVLDSLVKAIPDEWTPTSVARLARRITGGEDALTAVDEFDVASRTQVRAWFGPDRTRREVLEVTALAFVTGVGRRTFESLLARLETQLASYMPTESAVSEDKDAPDTIPAARPSRMNPGGLVGVERIGSGAAVRQALVFRVPAYRRQVLVELSERYETPFWDAVCAWLNQVLDSHDSLQIAYGIALLAGVDFDEVDSSFLQTWSDGATGVVGQITVAYVLWLMCNEESLAPLALQSAVRWTNSGTAAQRWTAALAFSGELGVRYATDAVRRLWQLITQGNEVSEDSCRALADLFANLADDTDNAGIVLTMLGRHLKRHGRRGADPRLRTLTMNSVLSVLSVRSARTGHRAAFSYLHANPDRTDAVAQLWAALLCHRGYRRSALQALWDGLNTLDDIGPDPRRDAAELGHALAAALPAPEHALLHRDLATFADRSRRRPAEPLVRALLAALEQLHQRTCGGPR